MNGAAAHLVMELEEKLVELEGLQGKQRTHVETQRTDSKTGFKTTGRPTCLVRTGSGHLLHRCSSKKTLKCPQIFLENIRTNATATHTVCFTEAVNDQFFISPSQLG